jgi:hypothetical protein
MDGTDKDSRMTDSGELSSELISEFALIVIPEDSTYGVGIRITDLRPEAVNRQLLVLIDHISAAYSELYRLERGIWLL